MEQETALAVIGMGSNLEDRFDHLLFAARGLHELPASDSPRFSPIYETAAVDCPEPLPFLNAVACLRTRLEPLALLHHLQRLERACGRARPYRHAPRTLDLDLLLFGDRVLALRELELPHPRLHERLFVTTPLADLAGDVRHPVLACTMAEIDGRLRASLEGASGALEPDDVVHRSRYHWPVSFA